MHEKSNKIIVIFLGIIIISIIVLTLFILLKPKDNKENLENTKIYEVVPNLKLAVGSNIPEISDFIKNIDETAIIKYYKNDEEIETLNLNIIGEYKVKIYVNDKEYESSLIIFDDVTPEIILKDVTIEFGATYNINSFVESCIDNSNEECILSFSNEKMSEYTDSGEYSIEILAKDSSENEIYSNAKLIINEEDNKKVEVSKKQYR